LTIEDRFSYGGTWTKNGATADEFIPLPLPDNNHFDGGSVRKSGVQTSYDIAIKLFQRKSDGSEVQISSDYDFDYHGTASCNPGTVTKHPTGVPFSLNSSDCIVVRIYARIASDSYVQVGRASITEVLGAQSLDDNTYTAYYCTSFYYIAPYQYLDVNWGEDNSFPSSNVYFELQNFSWTLGATQINVTDSCSGVDAASIQANVSAGESCGGVEGVGVQAQMTLNDSGTGSDVVSAQANVPVSDSGQGSDQAAVQACLIVDESALGSDDLGVTAQVTVPDSAQGQDDLAVQAQVSVADISAGLDDVNVQALLSVADNIVGDDSQVQIQALVTIADQITGYDDISIVGAALPTVEAGLPFLAVKKQFTVTRGLAAIRRARWDFACMLPAAKARMFRLAAKTSIWKPRTLVFPRVLQAAQSLRTLQDVLLEVARIRKSLQIAELTAGLPGVHRTMASLQVALQRGLLQEHSLDVLDAGALAKVAQAISAVRAVEAEQAVIKATAALTALEASKRFTARTMQRWIWNAKGDDKTCPECDSVDGLTVEITDISELEAIFPYGEAEGTDLFYPRVHPNCRCELVLLEVFWED
jgi:hypothetical protein